MGWKPTTRGVGGPKSLCAFEDCREDATDTNFYTRDSVAARFFCDRHWEYMVRYFAWVKRCLHCTRAHLADYYREHRTIDTVKFGGKWWELCETHKRVYDSEVELTLDSWF